MAFIWYDLGLLAIFVIFVSIFLYTRRKNLQKEGLLLLYRTPWGIKLINKIGKKYKKTMKALSWLSIVSGYLLMIGGIYLIYRVINIYLFNQDIVRAIKVPPITPLLPYIDKIVPGLPSFYFFYWIVIIIIIAIPHEFAHGIIAAYNKVKIKTTGFGFFPSFFPVFLAAFVELDEKAMSKKKKFGQMATLSAGTFANVIAAVILLGSIWIVFPVLFTPSGVVFDGYQMTLLNSSQVQTMDGKQVYNLSYKMILEQMLLNSTKEGDIIELTSENKTYILTGELFSKQGYKEAVDRGYVVVYEDSPALNAELNGTITEVNNRKIRSVADLQKEVASHKPGDTLFISTLSNGCEKTYEIILGQNPDNKTEAWLGIGMITPQQNSVMRAFSKLITFREAHVDYVPKLGSFSTFIYNLLWWATLICFSVALVNMLPVGIFDGGRFFYLTILAITGSEKTAKRTFSLLTYLFLFLIALLMVLWVKSFF